MMFAYLDVLMKSDTPIPDPDGRFSSHPPRLMSIAEWATARLTSESTGPLHEMPWLPRL